jgi:hypothetical protein
MVPTPTSRTAQREAQAVVVVAEMLCDSAEGGLRLPMAAATMGPMMLVELGL